MIWQKSLFDDGGGVLAAIQGLCEACLDLSPREIRVVNKTIAWQSGPGRE
jgi:hypothetical protein